MCSNEYKLRKNIKCIRIKLVGFSRTKVVLHKEGGKEGLEYYPWGLIFILMNVPKILVLGLKSR